jgi:hypothetical protein
MKIRFSPTRASACLYPRPVALALSQRLPTEAQPPVAERSKGAGAINSGFRPDDNRPNQQSIRVYRAKSILDSPRKMQFLAASS